MRNFALQTINQWMPCRDVICFHTALPASIPDEEFSAVYQSEEYLKSFDQDRTHIFRLKNK